MRRYFQILGLVVLAFAAGGWGTIVAAALCPHAGSLRAMKTGVAEDLSAGPEACHSEKPQRTAKPDCHDDPSAPEQASDTQPAQDRGISAALALPEKVVCTHCIGRPETPASTIVALRQQGEQKRCLAPAGVETLNVSLLPLQVRPVLYRQGAPPGSATPKHLLIGLLLI